MKKKILVVDDQPVAVKVSKKILEKRGYAVIGVTSGEECLKKAASEKPDLILLDVMLPEVSGMYLCECLKKGAATKDIPIIMITALTGESLEDSRKKSGAAYLIRKPCDPSDLLWAIEDVLKR